MTNERELLGEFQREIVTLQRAGHRMPLDLDPLQAVMLVEQLQIALRHPGNAGPAAKLARDIIERLATRFAGCPAVQKSIRHGWEQQL